MLLLEGFPAVAKQQGNSFLWFYQRVPEAGREKWAQWKHCGVGQQLSACLQLGRVAEQPSPSPSHSASGRRPRATDGGANDSGVSSRGAPAPGGERGVAPGSK